jgi:hypothetical protein
MNDPVVIWIVEDAKADARLASKVIEEITSGYKGEFDLDSVILWAKDFHWPPFSTFRASVDPTAPHVYRDDYPDVVVLDLLNRSETGEKLEGNDFYYNLRKWERSKGARSAFVVLWSFHQGGRQAERFIKDVEKDDQRLIPLATKQPPLLKRKLLELWKLIFEEREGA